MPVKSPLKSSELRVLVLGEAPGEEEDARGVPFAGEAGKLLREHIPQHWHEKLYWANIVRSQPKGNATPADLDVLSCTSAFLVPDLAAIRPHLIIAVGSVALHYFYPSAPVSFVRGIAFPTMLAHGETAWVYPVLHPSYISKSEDRQSRALMPLFTSDLKKLFASIDKYKELPVIPELPKKIYYPKTESEALQLFKQLKEPYGLDFETFKLRPYMRDARLLTAGFSDGLLTFALPIEWPGFDWGVNFIAKVGKSNKVWIAHGAAMELPWLITYSGNLKQSFLDTMATARMLHQRTMISSLATLTRLHLGFDIKAVTGVDAKDIVLKAHSLEQTLLYQAYDAWANSVLDAVLMSKLSKDQEDNVRRANDSTYSTVLMELLGLDVDLVKSLQLKRKFSAMSATADAKAHLLPEVMSYEGREGKSFSISAPDQVGHVLVKYCGIDLPPTKTGYSTDDDYLSKHRDSCRLAGYVLDYRQPAKLVSTYIDPILTGDVLGADGKLHPAYTTLLTATGRLSSENPNIQNFPKRRDKELREQVVAPKGYYMVCFDYGQLEARVIAMLSGPGKLAQSIVRKEDIHQRWLMRFLQVYPKYMEYLSYKTNQREEKLVLKGARDIIKTDFVFASFYQAQIKSIAARTGIPERIVAEVWEEFWSEYPEVRAWGQGSFKEYAETGAVHTLTNLYRNEMLPGNEPTNTPSQGTAAHIVLEAQNALCFRAVSESNLVLLPRINIHDDLGFFIPDDSDLERYIEVIAEEAVKPRFAFQNVPLMTECRIGTNWANLEAVGKFEGGYFHV
jgi:uracil-DNA glycosylase family 4